MWCPKCLGEGEIKVWCNYCQGNGFMIENGDYVNCRKCGGTGVEEAYPCPECDGTGEIEGEDIPW